jgi:hypothetical protein
MVSTAMDIVIIGNKAEEKRSMGMPFSDNPMILFFSSKYIVISMAIEM